MKGVFGTKKRFEQSLGIIFVCFILASLLPVTLIAIKGNDDEDSDFIRKITKESASNYNSKDANNTIPRENAHSDNSLDRTSISQNQENFKSSTGFLDPRFSVIPTYNETSVTNQIKANESFTLENFVKDINVNNSFDDDSVFQNISNIDFPSNGYINRSQSFSIENITTTNNYKNIEYEIFANGDWADSEEGLYQSVATSFIVTEPAINITQIRVWHGAFQGIDTLTGEAYITGVTNGVPNNTKIGNQSIILPVVAGTNTTLDFLNPVTLTAGTYAIVLNETSQEIGESYFRYRYVDDITGDGGVNESQMWTKIWQSPTWAIFGGDLIFSYEYNPLNPSDHSQLRQYSSPQEIQLKYNNTELTSFSDNNLLLSGDFAEFTSNSSIIFDLNYKINYESMINPVTLSTILSVDNGTQPYWNNSFSHNGIIPNGSYEINKRNYTIYNLPGDWENIKLEQDGTDFNSLTYTNGSSELILHLNQDLNPYSWFLQFTSPNYLADFTLKQNGSPLSAPYQVYTSDILTVIANLSSSSYNGKNASLIISDFNNILNYTELDVNVSNGDIVFTNWIISNNLSTQTQVNGSYQLIISWLSDNGTQIGYIGTDIEIITQTNIVTPTDIPDTVIGQNIPLSVNFLSNQSGLTIDGVNISYSSSWGPEGSLTQSGVGTNYNTTIPTSLATEGIGNITINTLLFGYANQSKIIDVVLLRNTSIVMNQNVTILNYKDALSITINYNDENTTHIPGANVLVNGSATDVTEPDNYYLFQINTSVYNYTTNLIFNISVSKLYFVSKNISASFTVLSNPTDVLLDNAVNNNTVINKTYSTGSEDAFTFNLRYFDTNHSTVIQNASLTDDGSSIASITKEQNPTNYSWIITVDPSIGDIFQKINFTYTKNGYLPISYFITLNITATPTEVLYGGEHTWTNGTVFNLTFSESSEDNLTIYMQYNDTDHGVLLNQTLEFLNASYLGVSHYVNMTSSNSTWSITIDPHVASYLKLAFVFYQDGYQNSTVIIFLDVSPAIFNLTYSINDPQNVTFDDQHTVTLNVTNVFDQQNVENVDILANSTVFTVNPLGNGLYNVTYLGATQWYTGTHTFLIRFNKTNFDIFNLYLNYTILSGPIFSTEVVLNNGSIIDNEWGDKTYLNISLIDPIHGISLPIGNFTWDINETEVKVELVLSTNKYHILMFTPQILNDWTLNLTLDPNLPSHFTPNSTILTITTHRRTTATVFTFIGAPDGIASVYYQRHSDIGIEWRDSELGIVVKGNFTEEEIIWTDVQLRIRVQYLNFTGGIHYFRVFGVTMDQITVTIGFNSSLFTLHNTSLDIRTELLPTNNLIVISDSDISNATLQSKFGYTIHLIFDWTIQDTNTVIYNPDVSIYHNGNILTQNNFTSFGLFVISNSSDHSSHIWITFFAFNETLGYELGWQSFEFKFSAFGMETQSYLSEIYTDGYDLDVTVTYKDTIIPGSDFAINVQILYANESNFRVIKSSTGSNRLQIIPQNTLLGFPIEDSIDIRYNIFVEYNDGSRGWVNLTEQTIGGESIFVLSDTGNIAKILSINIGIPSGNDNKQLSFNVEVDTLPLVEEIPGFPFEILFIAILLTAFFITTILYSYNRRRTRKSMKIVAEKKKIADTQEKIALISNIYTILIATSSGLPVFSILNSLYKDNPTISEIVSGLSVGIDTFLQSFQEDFMEQLGEHIAEDQQVSISNINRKTFQILILGTVSYRIFVFMKEKPPQFTNDIFRNIISELERTVKLEKLFDVTNVKPKVERIIRKNFPLTLLSTFVVDPGRLIFLENEMKNGRGPNISPRALLAIKQISLIRSGNITNLKLSPQDQGKEFNRLHKNGELGEIGIMHYEVAYNMLANTLKLPLELVLETLWTASNSEVLVLIPFSEEVLPITSGD
ncbi:MAG: hypothetical protein ACW967_00685 [Candidatus Hodarchaeales archaeon]|jgi:hypothetical protein